MSGHHCWYVTGRILRLAVAYTLFASLLVANPAFAAEDTDLAAQKMAISGGPVTALHYLGAERSSIENSKPTAGKNKAAGVFALPKTGQSYQAVLDLARKTAAKLSSLSLSSAGRRAPAGHRASDTALLQKTGKAYQAVLELTRKRNSIAPDIVVWEKDGEYFAPVTELAQILKFPSGFDPAAQKVEGEFFSPQNRYSINASDGTYSTLGKTFPLPQGAIFKGADLKDKNDLYVSIELLNKIWPLEFTIDVANQALSVNTDRKLPVELELERKKRQEKLERQKKEKELQEQIDKNYVYTPNGYRLLGPQTLFLSQNLTNKEDLNNHAFVSGQGDLLGTSATYSVNLSNSKRAAIDIEDFTVRLKREDYKSGKLLPYGLDIIDLGDISVRTPSLVSGSLQGTGVFVSTDRNRQNIDFDEVTVEGNSHPGWNVELYSGSALVDFGVVDELGRYRFENVPLKFGNNPIRLAFYGPQGEIEERTENYSIARSFLRPGETTWQAGIVKRGDRVVNLTEDENNGEAASSFRVNHGISRYMSGYATFTNVDLKKQPQKYLSVGANFNALNGYGQIEAYKQLDRGEALDLRYARNFMGFDTNLRSSVFKDFESKNTGSDAHRKTAETSLSIAKTFLKSFASLNFGLSATRTTYAEAETDTRLSATQAASTASFGNFSNTTDTNFRGGEMQESAGQIAFNRRLSDNFGLNSKLGYDLFPQKEFKSYDLNLSYTDNDRLTASLGYGQSLLDTSSRSVDLGAAYDFDAFRGNVNLSWDTEAGASFTLGTSTTLGPQGQENVYDFRRQIDGQPTKLSVRLYEDVNNDRRFGPEDRPIPDARIVLNGGKKSNPTNEEGFVEIAPAGGEGMTTITLDRQSMTYNPFLISAEKDGHVTILRAGTKPLIDFPLIMSGTIDGAVRDQSGRGMQGITVQLVDAYGKLVDESTTLADGFYNFQLVRPGRYIVQIHPSHRVFVPPKTVRVAADDLFVYATDLQVLSNQNLGQASAAAVANDVEETGRVAHTYHPQAIVGTEMPVAPSGGGVQPPAGKVSESGVQTAIRTVRFGEYPDKTRLVLDLSGPAVYRISKEDNGSVIAVDLPDTKWEAQFNFEPKKQNLFQNLEINQLPGGGTRIKLTGKGRIDVSHDLLLPAGASKSDRIYIDFIQAR